MDDSLNEVLLHNPWPEMAKKIQEALGSSAQLTGRFVLDQDDRIISEFENDYSRSASELVLSLPPQPFIGNPKAKIWILQFNPGHSKTIDDFDYLGIDVLQKMDRHKNCEVSNSSTLSDRLELICRQYSFSGVGFYALDEKYHTFKHGFKKGSGMYLWYRRILFEGAKSIFRFVPKKERKAFADDNLFVLEFFPYHSRGFSGINFFPFLPSFDFWRLLVQYAFGHEKILICHGLASCKSLTTATIRSLQGYDIAKKDGRIYKVINLGNGPSRLTLNTDRVKVMSSTQDRLSEFLRMMKLNYTNA